MITEWRSRAIRNMVINKDHREIAFHRGRYTTADKDEIRTLLASQEYTRGDIWPETPMEHIEKYLNGSTPDKFDKQTLETISPDGLRKLAKHYNLPSDHGGYAEVIRTMLRGKYIDNYAHSIMEQFKLEDTAENLFDEATEAGVIIYDKPWYKFDAPGMESPEPIERGRAEVGRWIVEHKDQVKEAIQDAEDTETKEKEVA